MVRRAATDQPARFGIKPTGFVVTFTNLFSLAPQVV